MTTAAPLEATTPEVAIIPLDQVHPVSNVRTTLRNIEELAESIRRNGLLTALTVERRPDGEYTLKAGYRRLAALRLLELTSACVVITPPAGAAERLGQQIAENEQRQALDDLDIADAVQQLLVLGADPNDVAASLGTTAQNIDAWKTIASLPATARELVETGDISLRDAHHLAALSDDADAIADCLRLVGQGWQVKGAVDSVLRERERSQRAGKARARLEKEGCAVIEAPKWGQFTGNSKTQRLGQGHGEIHIAKRAHAKQPCHAAYVDPHDGKPVYVCIDRNRHAGVEGSGVPDLKAERAAKRTEKKALREANANRFRIVGDAVRKRAIGRDVAVAHVLRLWVENATTRTRESAAELLGLELPDDAGVFAAEKAVQARAGESQEGLVEAALAVALAAGEHGLTTDRYDFSSATVGTHVAFLRETGVHDFAGVEAEAVRSRLPYEMRRELAGEHPDLEAEPAEGADDAEGEDDMSSDEAACDG